MVTVDRQYGLVQGLSAGALSKWGGSAHGQPTRVKPSSFDYHAPTSLDDAVALLADLGDDAKVLAGGQSLVPMLSLRLAAFENLVDIGRIPELRGVHHEGDTVVIGAATVDARIETDPEVAARLPLLARGAALSLDRNAFTFPLIIMVPLGPRIIICRQLDLA